MKKKRVTLTVILTAILVLVSGISVAAFSETGVLFHVTSGKVAIHLEEHTMKDGKEIPLQEEQIVIPGEVISKISKVVNEGEACYVRAKVFFDCDKEGTNPLTEKDLIGISSEWVKIGDYYYYQKILEEEKTVNFFEGIKIPEEWTSEKDSGNRWNAKVHAEAIQAYKMEPDFTTEDPWNLGTETEILDAPKEIIEKVEENMEPIQIEIDAELKGFSVDTNEFLRNMKPFMPGTEQKGILKLKNNTKKQRTVYLRAEVLEESALLDALEFEIRKKGEKKTILLYQGSLKIRELDRYHTLTRVEGGTEDVIEFFVKLPEEANNGYAAQQGKVKFYLTTDIPYNTAPSVKTGDTSNLWVWLLTGSVSVVCILYFMKRNKKV